MKRFLLLLVLISFTISVYCQQITFQKTYGGSGYQDEGYSVQQTSDGGYIICGETWNYGMGDGDVYLIKTNSYGDTLWTKTFGGTDGEKGYEVMQTSDGGYVMVGLTSSFCPGSNCVYLIKTDSSGSMLWSKAFGGSGGESARSVQQTSDGGYIIAGLTTTFGAATSNVYLIKTDGNGNALWKKAYSGVQENRANSVRQTADGGYIMVGEYLTAGATGYDVYLIKTDTIGNPIWAKTYGAANYNVGNSVLQTNDGGYIIAGLAHFGDVFLIRTDSLGDTLWTKTYGGTGYDEGNAIQKTTDGGFIIAGSHDASFDDAYLIKIDSSGNVIWSKTYGEPFESEYANSVFQTSDGGFIFTGLTTTSGHVDIYFVKTDSLGNTMCNQGNPTTIVSAFPIQVTNFTRTTITGGNEINPATIVENGTIVGTICSSVGIPSIINNPKSGISVYPNPFTSEFTIQSSEKINQIIIYDLIGTKVFQQELPSNNTSAELNLSFLQQGVYFLNVKSNGESWTKKIVKM